MKTIKASAKFISFSPRKLREISNAVKNFNPVLALDTLSTINKRAVRPLKLVFQQALGNAKQQAVSLENLKIQSLLIEEGPKGGKKADVHSHGARFDRGIRRKKFAHIKLILQEKEVAHGAQS